MAEMQEVEILLVEDNPNDAELTIRSLKKHNLANKLYWVKDGVQALDFIFGSGEYAKRQGCCYPKVVLLDLKLPKIDGLEVLRRIKSDEKTRLIPVAVLTSSREESDLIRSYELGVNSYIIKPVEFEEFSRAVAELGLYWILLNRIPKT